MIPPAAVNLILESEGLDQPSRWPGAQSGITLGRGYDLGFVTKQEFVRDWSPHLSGDHMSSLLDAIGLTGPRARTIAPQFRAITIKQQAADIVFTRATLPKYEEMTRRAFPGYDRLVPLIQGVLVSLVFNRGTSMGTRGQSSWDRRREMREIREAVQKGDKPALATIPGSLRSMKRLWAGQGVDGLITRREREARLVEAALG